MAWCLLCAKHVETRDLVEHLTEGHGMDVKFVAWPDGEPVVYDETLRPEDFA